MPLNPPITDWRNRSVWIIGASSGIGAALAQALLAQGTRVALSARREGALREVAGTHSAARWMLLPLDVTRSEDFAPALAQIVDAWGGVDLVVLCAGNHDPMRAFDFHLDRARALVEINVNGALNALATVVPQLLRQHSGGIAVLSSVAGYRGLPTSLIYGATKAALINLTETLYLDLAPRGISVWLINPGFVRTPLTERNEFRMPALISPEEAAQEIIAGLARGGFEIHFPKRFTRWLKLARCLPYRWYFPLVRKVTGL